MHDAGAGLAKSCRILSAAIRIRWWRSVASDCDRRQSLARCGDLENGTVAIRTIASASKHLDERESPTASERPASTTPSLAHFLVPVRSEQQGLAAGWARPCTARADRH